MYCDRLKWKHINNYFFIHMSTEESFSVGANGTEEGVGGQQAHPELYSLQKEEHDKGVAAFQAALATRVNQVEAGGSTTEEATEEARRQFDEAYQRIQEKNPR